MGRKELHETLLGIARVPGEFYRDTPMLLKTLDNIEAINRRIKDIGHDPERREPEIFAPGYHFKNQAS